MSYRKLLAYGALLFLVIGALESALQRSSLVAAIATALLAEFVGGKMGIAWNDPQAPLHAPKRYGARLGLALGVGATAAALTLGLGAVAGAIALEPLGRALPLAIGAGVLEAAFVAVQREITERGILRLWCRRTAPQLYVPLAALVAAACAYGRAPYEPAGWVAAAGLGALSAVLWERSRSAFVPVATHATFLAVLGPLTGASSLGLRGLGTWGGAPPSDGLAAGLACALVAAGLFVHHLREQAPDPARAALE